MNLNLAINAPRLVQAGVGGAALFGGWKLASSVVREAYREDLLGDPTRVVEVDGRTLIYQTREAQGGKLTHVMMGAGAASAFAGGALLLGNTPALAKVPELLRGAGGVALFTLGLGAIAGATAMSAQYKGADFEPVR